MDQLSIRNIEEVNDFDQRQTFIFASCQISD